MLKIKSWDQSPPFLGQGWDADASCASWPSLRSLWSGGRRHFRFLMSMMHEEEDEHDACAMSNIFRVFLIEYPYQLPSPW